MADKKIIRKIGLALGGGGAKGLAHIGVIKALKWAGIPIDYIAGTSMGAIVGGWYAATGDIEALEEIFLKIKSRDIFPLREVLKNKNGSLFKGDYVEKLLKDNLKNIKIENCKVPFGAVATDVSDGNEVVLSKGSLVEAIRASIALPVIFSPVKIGGRLLMDGGFSNPVPADVVRKMGADYVIAVDVSSQWTMSPERSLGAKDIFDAMSSTLSVVEYQLAKHALVYADVVLRPPVMNFRWLDFNNTDVILKMGMEEAEIKIKEIRKGARIPEPPKTIGDKFFDFLFHGEGS